MLKPLYWSRCFQLLYCISCCIATALATTNVASSTATASTAVSGCWCRRDILRHNFVSCSKDLKLVFMKMFLVAWPKTNLLVSSDLSYCFTDWSRLWPPTALPPRSMLCCYHYAYFNKFIWRWFGLSCLNKSFISCQGSSLITLFSIFWMPCPLCPTGHLE